MKNYRDAIISLVFIFLYFYISFTVDRMFQYQMDRDIERLEQSMTKDKGSDFQRQNIVAAFQETKHNVRDYMNNNRTALVALLLFYVVSIFIINKEKSPW
jgi:hypothetical protein